MSALTATRIPISEALPIARAFVREIEPYCERVQIAGSIRRGATQVKDVEIVAVPRIEADQATDMFGETVSTKSLDRLHEHLERLLAAGTVSKRPRSDGAIFWGPSAKYLLYQGVPVDLFTPDAERFGWILALRTGPQEFSRQLVVERGSRTKDGRQGLLPSRLKPFDGWLTERVSGKRLPTPEEADVFDLFGLPYRAPEHRR